MRRDTHTDTPVRNDDDHRPEAGFGTLDDGRRTMELHLMIALLQEHLGGAIMAMRQGGA